MKRIGISLATFSLSLLILIGVGQFTVGKMICTGDGQSSYSIGKAKDCCDQGNNSHQEEASCCCELINISYSLDHFSTSQKISIGSQHTDLFQLPTADCILPTYQISFTPSPRHDPPPPDSKGELYFLRSLLL